MKKQLLLVAALLAALPLAAQEERGSPPWTKRYEAMAVDTNSADGRSAFNAAVRASRDGNHAMADKYFTLSIARGYLPFSSHAGKAEALKELGKIDEAIKTLEQGMKTGTEADSLQRQKLEAMYVSVVLARGRARLRENEIARAAASYTLLTRMKRACWKMDGFIALGTLYTVHGNAILEGITNKTGKRFAARARERAADAFKKSRDYLDRAARLFPDDPRLLDARSRLDESSRDESRRAR
ncbi:MAG: hypothetical protein LBF09_07080 [Odoribacteraceae bacterium]|nr:hypothetical protein [Odoribacteraceae bacterium]